MDEGPPTTPPAADREPTTTRPRTLYREPEDKKLSGICSGLADYTGVEPGVMRACVIALAIVVPITVVAYAIGTLVIDERPPDVPRTKAPPAELLGWYPWLPVAVIVGAVLVGFDDTWWWWFDVPLGAPVLIGVGVWLLVRNRSDDGEPPPFDPSTESPRTVVPTPSQSPRSTDRTADSLSLGVDTTTENDDAEPTVDQPADLRDAADEDADAGRFADTRLTGSPPADEGAGPPGGLPPLTPPGWPGPESAPGGPAAGPGPGVAHPVSGGPGAGPEPGVAQTVSGVAPTGPEPGVPTSGSVPGGPTSGSVPGGPVRGVAHPMPGGPAAGPDRSPRLGLVVAALILVGVGGTWLLGTATGAEVDPRHVIAGALLVAGAGLVVATWWGRGRAVLVPIGVIGIAGLAAGEVIDVPLDAGMGDRTVEVTRAAELDDAHELLFGRLVLDLRDAPLSRTEPTEIAARVGVGELQVIVPRGANVVAEADVRAGAVTGLLIDGNDQDAGVLVDQTYVIDGREGAPRLELTLDVGVGELEVVHG